MKAPTKRRRRVFFLSSRVHPEEGSSFHGRLEKRDLRAAGDEEKGAILGSVRAINPRRTRRCVSVPHFVLILLILFLYVSGSHILGQARRVCEDSTEMTSSLSSSCGGALKMLWLLLTLAILLEASPIRKVGKAPASFRYSGDQKAESTNHGGVYLVGDV